MTDTPNLPPLGNYDEVPALNLSGLSVEEIQQALPTPTPEQQQEWNRAMSHIRMTTAANIDARQQVASVLASVAAVARSIGMVLTIA